MSTTTMHTKQFLQAVCLAVATLASGIAAPGRSAAEKAA